MTKAILAMTLGLAISASAARAGDTKPSDDSAAKKEKPSECEHHGFFHPLSKFWVHTVGGRMSYGLKSFAGNVRHGIGGEGKD